MRAYLALSAVLGALVLAPATNAAVPAPVPAVSAIIPVAGGCGPGAHPQNWRGPYGHWHTRCVANGPGFGVPAGRGCGPGMVWRRWRGPYGHWHEGCARI